MTPHLPGPVRTVVIATDAGYGSSVLMATQLSRLLPSGVAVLHSSVDSLPVHADVVLVRAGLADRVARGAAQAVVRYEQPVGDPAVVELAAAINAGWGAPAGP